MSGTSKRHSLEEWKTELVGKTFGWLTVTDIIVDTDHKMKCVCRCKCGNTKLVLPCHISKLKVTSCGCYTGSKEYLNSRHQLYTDNQEYRDKLSTSLKKFYKEHPEKRKEASDRAKLWCKENPDKVKEVAEKCRQFYNNHPEKRDEVGKRTSEWYKNHPEDRALQSENMSKWYKENKDKINERSVKFKEWCKNNPNKLKDIGNKISTWCEDNKDKVKERSSKMSEWYKNHPDDVKNRSNKFIEWCRNNPDKVRAAADKRIQWYKNNPDKVSIISDNRKEWCKNNKDKLLETGKKSSDTFKSKRRQADFTELINIIHPNYYNSLIKGELKSTSVILTKCPLCGEYDYHSLHNVFKITHSSLKSNNGRLCDKCNCSLTQSKSEQEIANYISTFYNGELIRNSREIISPLELDLYYPEKKIAIEFNGDYWHSEEFKDKDYHYNKFKSCLEKCILLVSIFESDWNLRSDEIKKYLFNLFDGIENSISFNNQIINNNYPPPYITNIKFNNSTLTEDYYIYRDRKVYTCGYTQLL